MLVGSAVNTDGAAAPTHTCMVGGKVFTGVPAAEANGDLVAPWIDENRRIVLYSFSFTSEAFQVEDVAPAVQAPYEPVSMAQLTAPGATDPIEMLDFDRLAVQIILANKDTNVIVELQGSLNGTAWFSVCPENAVVTGLAIAGSQATITVDGTYQLTTKPFAARFGRFNFISEAGGANATIDVMLKAKC